MCQASGSNNFPQECYPLGEGPGLGLRPTPLAGFHASGWGFHGNSGVDQFWLTPSLQNGWVLDSASVDWAVMINNGGSVKEASSFGTDPGISDPELGVDWSVNNCGGIGYQGHMIIVGPVGVPY
jgi:hypothetical protein